MAASTKRPRLTSQSSRSGLGEQQFLEAWLQEIKEQIDSSLEPSLTSSLRLSESPLPVEVTQGAASTWKGWASGYVNSLAFKFLQATPKEQVETLSNLLWRENADLAKAAWDTKYIKGMASGTLDPRDYGQYMVQDAAYCRASTANLEFLVDKTKSKSLKEFIRGRYNSYKDYAKHLYDQWFLKPDGVDVGEAAQWYVDLERKVAQEEEPLYYLVAMIPCLRLYAYLANKMKAEGNYKNSNIYKFWIKENESYDHAKKVEDVVNQYSGPIDHQKASQIYRKCMYGEVNFFRSACDEPLLTIPS